MNIKVIAFTVSEKSSNIGENYYYFWLTMLTDLYIVEPIYASVLLMGHRQTVQPQDLYCLLTECSTKMDTTCIKGLILTPLKPKTKVTFH